MTNNKIKLALFWSTYIGEGTSFNELARGLDPQRYDLIFISLKKRNGDPEKQDNNGHKVYYLSDDHRINSLEFGILWKLVKILKSEGVDILHAHRHKPVFYAAIASYFVNLKVVFGHVHGMRWAKSFLRKVGYFLWARRITKFVAVSKAIEQDIIDNFTTVGSSQVAYLPNSIDFDRFANVEVDIKEYRRELGIPEGNFTLISIGRFAATKGYGFLVEAFEIVKEKNPQISLLIVGQGRDRDAIQEKINRMGLHNDIILTGYRGDVPELLKISDAFVLSSIHEAFGFVVAESMAAGLPVVVTDSGGPTEVVSGTGNDFVANPGDPHSLANAIISCIEMPEDRRGLLIKRSREKVESEYSHKKVLEKLVDLYESELSK